MSLKETPENEKYPQSSPWSWISTLYFTQGLPNALVLTVSTIMYTKLGASLKDIGLYTSLLGMAWVIKPLWGPLIDLYGTKRKWTINMQLLMGICLILVGVCVNGPGQLWWYGTLSAFSLVALFSATHDIAADGYYMVALSERKQAMFVGIRSTFFRLATIFATGILFILIGNLEERTSPEISRVRVVAKSPDGNYQEGYQKPLSDKGFLYTEPALIEIAPDSTGTITLKLKEKPENEMIVTLTRETKGTVNSIFKIGPEEQVRLEKPDFERLVFNESNWNTGIPVNFKVDQNLSQTIDVDFKAVSGNLRLTWSIVYFALGSLLVGLAGWHFFAMKKAPLDGPTEKATTSFTKAVFSMALVVGGPIAVYWAVYELIFLGLNSLIGDFMATKFKDPLSIYKFLINGMLFAFVWIVLKYTIVGTWVKSLFVKGARTSGVPYDKVFASFFSKPNIGIMLTFLLVYRLGEALLVKMSGPFLITPLSEGGMGLSTSSYGLAYGTIGVLTMTMGGILGGMAISKKGLLKWMLPMCIAINIPDLFYVYMAYAQPENYLIILAAVATETFGYGFGFTAYLMYMLYIAEQSEHKTSHYALCTGFMALGMMIPGMVSGDLAVALGWTKFFIVVCVATIPGFIMLKFIPLDPQFGCRKEK